MKYVKLVSLFVMALIYFAAGVNHFVNPDFYTNIMPPYFPFPLELVYLSGIIEIILAIGLIWERTRRWSAWAIIAMLVAFMPVHIHMIADSGSYPDVPLWGLWLRISIQGLLILWAWAYTGRGASTIATNRVHG